MMKVLFLLLAAVVCLVSAVCRVYLKSNVTQEHAPLLLKQQGAIYTLLQPQGPFFQWKSNEHVTIACANLKNKLMKTDQPMANITCLRDQQFRLNNQNVQFNELSCSSEVVGSVKPQNRPCAGGTGKMYDIGFEVYGVPFVRYFQVCHNGERSSVVYTEHNIVGYSIDVAQVNNDRPSFKVGGLKSSVRYSSVYTQNAQKDRFKELLGSEQQAEKYIFSSSFLAKGHLTPDGDAILTTRAKATYFYINTAPEWQVINVGNWVRVENAVRKIASSLNDTVQVFTGVYDVLTLPDATGREVPITLAENSQLEAPKWFWKIVRHAASNSAIALITLNNPFAQEADPLCSSVCDRYGWAQKEYQDLRKGYTYCCSVQELRKVIKFIPTKADAANILRFN